MALDTIKYQGRDYATVPVRLKEFREKNIRSSVTTKPMFQEDGSLIFMAEIVTDKSDPSSSTATGHARYSKEELAKPKAFEKLETVATGRALSLLGYLNNGEVASTEEMLEFEDYKQHQFDETLDEIKTFTKREQFKEVLDKMTPEQKQIATPIINARLKELKDGNTSTSPAA